MRKCTFDGSCRHQDPAKACTWNSWCRFLESAKRTVAVNPADAASYMETLRAMLAEATTIPLALADLDSARHLAAELHERLVARTAL
jgi:hypothetical protein